MKLDLDKYTIFIFDFDGVIADTVDVKTGAFAQLYEPFGREVVSKVVAHHTSHGGVSRFEKIRLYHQQYLKKKLSDSELVALTQQFSDLVFGKVLQAPFISGVSDFLELLKNNDKKLFVISATPEDEINKIVKGKELDRYFIEIKGSPELKKDNLNYLIGKYGIDVSKCVYFGDSKEDYNAAVSVNIPFIPINYFDRRQGYRDFSELMEV